MSHQIRPKRDVRIGARPTREALSLSTRELLALHERFFGALDPKAKARILGITRARGWAEDWPGIDGLAA
jgi:hypothetical protein